MKIIFFLQKSLKNIYKKTIFVENKASKNVLLYCQSNVLNCVTNLRLDSNIESKSSNNSYLNEAR